LVNKLASEGRVVAGPNTIAKVGHEIRFDTVQQAKVQSLMLKFAHSPYAPPAVKECQVEAGEELVNALVELGELQAVSSEIVFRKRDYDSMVAKVHDVLVQNGRITLAEVRDLFNTSRKYAQALLEHLDSSGLTVREGDYRKLRK
jgi:selenocysteine-specific elongation factor